jgi:hypothetical protein
MKTWMWIGVATLAGAIYAPAADPIKATVTSSPNECSQRGAWNQVGVEFLVESGQAFGTESVQHRLIQLWRWFDAVNQQGSAQQSLLLTITPAVGKKRDIEVGRIEIVGGGAADWTPDPRRPKGFRPPDQLRFCAVLLERLPDGSLDAEMKFLTPSPLPGGFEAKPADLNDPAKGAISGPVVPAKPPDARKPENAAKTFDRELDFAGVLLSSVQDITQGQSTVRRRTTKATADLFLSPLLRLTALSFAPGKYWVTFFTPFSVEAHVSNQKITKDTLSQNRISMGPEYEFRRYLKNSQGVASDNILRFIFKASSASDRDFKLIEPKFVAEFRPVWGIANRNVLDDKYLKGLKGFQKTTGDKLGRKLAPFFGFEKGHSYVRGIPAQALSAIGAFTRGYFGIDTGLNWNSRISLATTQQFYVRGERDNDAVHYMKNTLEWTFLASRPAFASSLFVTLEKGSVPPFRSAVNSVSLGIRVQSSRWFSSSWR